MLDKHETCLAFSRAWLNTGKRIAARMAIMAITTKQLNEGEATMHPVEDLVQ